MRENTFSFDSSGSQSWLGLNGSSLSLAIADYVSKYDVPALIICEDDFSASDVANEIAFFKGVPSSDLLLYPDTETLPYDQQSPHGEIISQRNAVINSLVNNKPASKVIVCSIASILRHVPSLENWKKSILKFGEGFKISQSDFVDAVEALNYKKVEYQISSFGEYAVRCNIVDLFPMGFDEALRIRFDDGKVSSIKILDVNSSMSADDLIDQIDILPAMEFPVNFRSTELFKRNYLSYFKKGVGDKTYDSVKKGDLPNGIEFLMPFFVNETCSIFDLLQNTSTTIFTVGDIKGKANACWKQINERYNDLVGEPDLRIIQPSKLWFSTDDILDKMLDFDIININPIGSEANSIQFEVSKTGVCRQENIKAAISNISDALTSSEKSAILIHSKERLPQINLFCDMSGYEATEVSSWNNFIGGLNEVSIITSLVDNGFKLDDPSISVITEKEIFGQILFSKEAKQESQIDHDENDFLYLKEGDYISHIEYGICKYQGLEKIEFNGKKNLLFVAEFADGAKKFINLDELFYVNRYDVPDGKEVKLTDLSRYSGKFFYVDSNFKSGATKSDKRKNSWAEKLANTAIKVSRVAKTLIETRAANAARKGIKFDQPDHRYVKFCRDFPYRETIDQMAATNDIISDMTSTKVMDRTVIADVGFGKTEIANRAIFMAVASGYQACLLAPTTLLARQHYENLLIRFENTGFKIACLSREITASEERKIILAISKGEIDIVIGTHKVFQKDVQYKNLGLFVIDEEHRFGVKDKETLRSRKANLDVLYLTATPIPRTLNMALNGVKDMSVVKTPPAKRLSIRTLIRENNPAVIKEAVSREMMRKGQIFVLHNSIESIEQRALEVESIIPGIRVMYAHGQMKESELSHIMSNFYAHNFDVLISTTLIENGIDVPNANTIIIDSADKLGVAQLHQLRGRVGRSTHQAYAYLLKSSEKVPVKSLKRLEALEKASNLGDGLLLANHDLQIRGAGELLGEEQSGEISEIGFQNYMKILNHEIENLENQSNRDFIERPEFVTMSLGINTEISPSYIEYTQARISYYKRLSSANSMAEIHAVEKELVDKFGLYPEGTKNLISVSKLRFLLKQTGVCKITVNDDGGKVEVGDSNEKAISKVAKFVNSADGKLLGCEQITESVFRYNQKTTEKDRIMSVFNLAKGINGI
jgi:transcription-repair coupling factor (superfamily II helicase)